MLIKKKLQQLSSYDTGGRNVDWLVIEWYETNKRILHKKTNTGLEVTMQFLQANQNLTQGDVVYQDAESIVAIEIADCDAIILKPKSMYEMAAICYEIGNRHVPIFIYDNEVVVAFEVPLFNVLQKNGYDVKQGKRKLLNPLKTSVLPHGSNSFLLNKTEIITAAL